MTPLRQYVYYLLENDSADSKAAQIIRFGLAGLIFVNIVEVVLSTVPSLSDYRPLFATIERVSLAVFTVEYILRL